MKRILQTVVLILALLPVGIAGAWARRNHPATKMTRITPARAREIVRHKYPGATVDARSPLELEDGRWQYAVTVHLKSKKATVLKEVMVGATSGKIEAEEVTTAAEEAKEKAADAAKARQRKAR